MKQGKAWTWLGATLATAALAALSGCARNPTSDDPDPVSDLPGSYDTTATGPILAARQAHEDAHTRHRLLALGGGEDTAAFGRALGKHVSPRPFALRSGGNPAASGPRRAPIMAAATGPGATGVAGSLPKRGPGLPEASAWGNLSDTTGIDYGDSAKGFIRQVRQAELTDTLGAAQVRDSLVYRWPHFPASPTVLAHVQSRSYAGGLGSELRVFDDDGDGILNEAAAGKVVKLRKEWTLRSADTAWKTVAWTTHGQTTYYDSLGAGTLSTWTDSALIAGKPAWWQRLYDGDGDGRVLTAAAGSHVKVMRDAFAANRDGSLRLDYEAYLAGPDGDFLASADNVRLPFRSMLIDAQGRDLMQTVFGDADGDGLWWSPAAGAENRGYVVNTHAPSPSDSLSAFKDSTVILVPASPAAPPRILAYSAEARRLDGISLAWSTRLGGGATSFSGTDTVQVRERTSYADYAAPAGASPDAPESDWDSTTLVYWLTPGDLETTSDDRLVKWYSEVHYKTGRALTRTAEFLKADHPFAPGETPASGTYIREDHFRPVSGQSLSSIAETREFGAGSADKPWKQVRRYENGDSTVATGRALAGGIAAYAQDLGPGKRASGRREPASGNFTDTLTWFDSRGEAVAREITVGTLDGKTGTGEYRRRLLRFAAGSSNLPDTAEVRYLLTREGTTRGFIRIAGEDSLPMTVSGDTVHIRRELGEKRATMRWHPSADGTFALHQDLDRPAHEEMLGRADYVFGADGAGAGVHTRTSAGGATREGKVEFRSDGSVYYDGVKVVTRR